VGVNVAAAVADQVATLTAAGVAATNDARNLNPPAVLVLPPSIGWRIGRRSIDYLFTGLLVVGNAGSSDALDAVGELIDAVQTALGGALQSADPADVPGIDGAAPGPGYRVTWGRTYRTD
jgi:hypothetical protein